MPEADSVTVGGRAHRAPNAERTARARYVFDEQGLAECDLYALRHNPHHRVGRTAGEKRHDDSDGMRREIFRERVAAERQHSKRGQNYSPHPTLPRATRAKI